MASQSAPASTTPSPALKSAPAPSPVGQLTVWQQPHFHLSQRCCLCKQLYKPLRDRIVAITSSEGSLTHTEVALCHFCFPPQGNAIDAYNLAPYRYRSRTSTNPFPHGCRERDCSPANPDTINRPQILTLHLSCFNRLTCLDGKDNVFKRFSWLMRCRSSPFAGAPRLHIRPMSPYPVCPSSSSPQAINLVGTHRFESPFWKLARSMEVEWRLKTMRQGSSGDVDMAVVKDWKRGDGYHSLKKHHEHLRTVRIALDAYGIQKIERLFQKPEPFSQVKPDDKAYIVVDDWEIQGVTLALKWDLGRIVLPDHHPGLQVWDTPTPPHIEYYGPRNTGTPVNGDNVAGTLVNDPNGDTYHLDQCEWMLQECDLAGSPYSRMSRFYTIDLTSVTGLTFLYGPTRGLIAIHGHTATKPVVEVPREAPENMHWIYMPVPPDDEIMSIGAHIVSICGGRIHTPAFQITTRLTGTVYVGSLHLGRTPQNVYSRDVKQLMYNRVDRERGLGTVDTFGLFPRDPSRIINDASISAEEAEELEQYDDYPFYYSWAPLEDVARIRIYRHDHKKGSLQGMLIDYRNGGQRRLGRYRADSILAEDCKNPTGFCVYNVHPHNPSYDPAGNAGWIWLPDLERTEHLQQGWGWYPMQGELRLSFRGDEVWLSVDKEPRPLESYLIPIVEGDSVRYTIGS